MVAYILKFILCSGFLYSFYKVFLERESMYKINRFYLLLSLIFSLVAPFYKMELPMTMEETNLSPELLAYLLANPQVLEQESGWNYGEIFNIFYGIIGVGLFIRFALNILIISYRIKQDEKFKMDEITYVLDQKTDQPFSFLNYIFLPQENYEDIHPNLIQHEKAHCIQRHSWDIVFIELFQIIFWFNPFIYLYKKSIKLNHEFLADEYVLQNDVDVKTYQHQILYCIATQSQNSVASHFNFILTKKRLLMMTKHTSKRKVRILSFATFPFIFSAFVLFSQKSFAQEVELNAKKVEKVLDNKVKVINLGISTDGSKTDTIKKIKTYSYTLKGNDTIAKNVKEIVINDNDFKNIQPSEIAVMNVNKNDNSIQIIKNNKDTLKYYVKSNFIEDSSPILKLDNIKLNEILTPAIKAKLKDINVNNFAGIEMINRNGTKVIKVEDKILVFDSKDKLISQSSVPSKNETIVFGDNILYNSKNNSVHTFGKELTKEQQQAIVEAQEKIKNSQIKLKELNQNSGWKIDVQPHSSSELTKNSSYPIINGNSISVKSFYIETEPKTKEQITKELENLKSREKETKKRIKELEKQQKKLK